MPALLRVGSEVSSATSKTARLISPPPGKKRRVRERVYGVIMRSMPSGAWEVQWAGQEVESIHPSKLKHEGEPTDETMIMVRVYNSRRWVKKLCVCVIKIVANLFSLSILSQEDIGLIGGPLRSPVSDRGDSTTTWTTNPSQSVAIVPYRLPPIAPFFDMSESGNLSQKAMIHTTILLSGVWEAMT